MNSPQSGRKRSRPAKRRRTGPGKPGGIPFVLVVLAIVIFSARVVVVRSLTPSPLFLQPTLLDGSYQAEMIRSSAALGERTELPRGSLLYPALSAVLPGAGEGDPSSLRFVQSALDALAGLLLAFWVYRRFGGAGAIATGVLYALDPLGGFFAARLLPTSMVTVVFALVLVLLDGRKRPRASTPSALLIGGLLGLGFLLDPLLFFILTALLVWRTGRPEVGSQDRGWGRAALLAAPLALAALFLVIRNDGLRGGGPALSWGSGYSAFQAVSPATAGTPRNLRPPAWESDGQIRSRAWESLEREGTSYDVYRFYATRAFQQAVEHPVETVGVLLTKTAATIGAWPVPDALSPTFSFDQNVPLARHGSFSFAYLLALGAGGWWVFRQRRKVPDSDSSERGEGFSALELGLMTVGLACLLGPASAAARQPALPLLAAFAGVWVATVADAGRRGIALRAAPLGLIAAVAVLSLGAGFLSPTTALRNPSEDLRLLANNFAATSNWRQAIPLLESAVAADSLNLEARALLARGYQNDGLIVAAEEQLELAHAADSTHAGSLLALSSLAMARGDRTRAIALVNSLVVQRPNNPLYLNELGQLVLRAGDIPLARRLFVRALEIKPDYRVASENLQVVETLLQRAEDQLYPAEMRLPADDPIGQQLPSVVLALQNEDWTLADSLISLAEAERGEFVLPHWLRGAYHARRGDLARAITALETCTRLAPCRPAVVETLAGLYQQSGRTEDALRVINECLGSSLDEPRQGTFSTMLERIQAESSDSTAVGNGR